MGESSSVPVETAQELLSSVCFVIGEAAEQGEGSLAVLSGSDPDILFERGQKAIQEKIAEGRKLWTDACLTAPEIRSQSYRDTLREIGAFFRQYDFRFFAHQIPCSIDYQLCLPVPESLSGIRYVNEYLRRILIENGILHCFEKDRVIRLLKSCCPDYDGLLINLCEPAVTNALGLTLLGEDPRSLQISDEHRETLLELLHPFPRLKKKAALEHAAEQLCRFLQIRDPAAKKYLSQIADGICPRLSSAVKAGDLSGLFPPLS
jgi:hypothetical protein